MNPRRPGLPTGGSVSTALSAAMIIVSALANFAGRKLGTGGEWLVFDADLVLAGQLWRLVTYPFVQGDVLQLVFSAVIFYMMVGGFEARRGPRATLRFYLASSIGGALLSIVLHPVLGIVSVFGDRASAEGPFTVITALLVILALEAPDAIVLFGFILPMTARHVVQAVVGFDVLVALMQGRSTLSVTLGSLAMGWLLHTGRWHPRTWRRRRPAARRRSDIYIVRPREHDVN